MTKSLSALVLLASLITVSFTSVPEEAVDTSKDLDIYIEGVDWDDGYFYHPGGVACGGGFGDSCPVIVDISLYTGDYPTLFYVDIFKNGTLIDSYEFYPNGFGGTGAYTSYDADSDDVFYVRASGLLATGGSSGGSNSAALSVTLSI